MENTRSKIMSKLFKVSSKTIFFLNGKGKKTGLFWIVIQTGYLKKVGRYPRLL
jgi:hypothetical protein